MHSDVAYKIPLISFLLPTIIHSQLKYNTFFGEKVATIYMSVKLNKQLKQNWFGQLDKYSYLYP